ncbi:MAG: DUF4864 domain-containing protein, partial [bacterium]|nr:DUF4864 domain-containing protein [bacterium]
MALSLIALIVYLTSNLTDLVENQLSALKIRDLNKAYSFTSVAFQKNLPLERFEQFVAHLPFLQDNEHVSFTYRDINSDTGSLTAL